MACVFETQYKSIMHSVAESVKKKIRYSFIILVSFDLI